MRLLPCTNRHVRFRCIYASIQLGGDGTLPGLSRASSAAGGALYRSVTMGGSHRCIWPQHRLKHTGCGLLWCSESTNKGSGTEDRTHTMQEVGFKKTLRNVFSSLCTFVLMRHKISMRCYTCMYSYYTLLIVFCNCARDDLKTVKSMCQLNAYLH